MYFQNYTASIPNGTHPDLDSIDGGQGPTSVEKAGGESDLDIEVSYPIIWPQKSVLYEVGVGNQMLNRSIMNPFLDALDTTYCTHSEFGETGDNTHYDPEWPDLRDSDGYKGNRMCGTFIPTNVMSISYGSAETDPESSKGTLLAPYLQRGCNEVLKLGLQGVSVLVASDDSGVCDSSSMDNLSGLGDAGAAFGTCQRFLALASDTGSDL